MTMTEHDCERILGEMSGVEQARFLARLGHCLTIVGREAYEFQGPEVTNARLLRDLNEIYHRIYAQIASLAFGGSPAFPPDVLASWLMAEEKSEQLQQSCLTAFERALAYVNQNI
jgi:hypothetical protein